MEADAGGDVLVAVLPLVFQIEVARALLVFADLLFPQQIVIHGAGLGAKAVQPVRPLHPVQKDSHKTLHGDGLAGAIAAPKQQPPACEMELSLIIIPIVQNAGPVGLPAVFTHAFSSDLPLPSAFCP